MFIDPFQKMAADAKDDREKLDRLLTVSAPHERVLIAAVTLALIAFCGWLFFGSFSRSVAVDGVLSEAPDDGRTLQALVWLDQDLARDIVPGAELSIALSDSAGTLRFSGELSSLVVAAVPGWPEAMSSLPAASLYQVTISLEQGRQLTLPPSAPCRIEITLGRQSPAALLGLG